MIVAIPVFERSEPADWAPAFLQRRFREPAVDWSKVAPTQIVALGIDDVSGSKSEAAPAVSTDHD